MAKCPSCMEEVRPGASACPHCQRAIFSTDKTTHIVLAVLAVVGAYLLIDFIARKQAERDWQQIRRESEIETDRIMRQAEADTNRLMQQAENEYRRMMNDINR